MEGSPEIPDISPVPPGAPTKPCQARRHFHVALASILLPVLTWPIVLIMLVLDVCSFDSGTEQRRWTRRLIGLFMFDLFVVLALIVLRNSRNPENNLGTWGSQAGTDHSPRIGVAFEPSGQDTRVRALLRDGPAARAGLREGDVIVSIDGADVSADDEVTEVLDQNAVGVARRVRYVRNGETFEATIVPEVINKPWNAGLLDTWPGDGSISWLRSAIWLLPALVIALISWIVAKFRGAPRISVWTAFILVLAAGESIGLASVFGMKALLGGYSGLGMLVSFQAETLVFLLLSLALIVGFDRGRIQPGPRAPFKSQVRLTLQALLYLVTGLVRLGALLYVFTKVLPSDPAFFDPIRYLAGMRLGISGVMLLVAEVVVFGPLAEELLFRGFLLPRLSLQLGQGWAIGVSSLVFASLHQYQGIFMVSIVFTGVILGWARLRTGGLAVPVVLHMFHNAWVAFLMLK